MNQSYALKRLSAFSFHSKVDRSSLLYFKWFTLWSLTLHRKLAYLAHYKAFPFLLKCPAFNFKRPWVCRWCLLCLTIILIEVVQAVSSKARYQSCLWKLKKIPTKFLDTQVQMESKDPTVAVPCLDVLCLSYNFHIRY